MARQDELSKMGGAKDRLDALRGHLDITNKKERLSELTEATTEPGFWDDPDKAQDVMQKPNALKRSIASYETPLTAPKGLPCSWKWQRRRRTCPSTTMIFSCVKWKRRGGPRISANARRSR